MSHRLQHKHTSASLHLQRHPGVPNAACVRLLGCPIACTLCSQEAAASQHAHAARRQARPHGAGKGGKGGQAQAGSAGPQQRDPVRATTAEAEALRKADRVGQELKARQEQGELHGRPVLSWGQGERHGTQHRGPCPVQCC